MIKLLARSALVLFVLSILTGVVYPLFVTGLAIALFPRQAAGSLIERNGRIVGSALVGQSFTDSRYFHGRPSATATPYDARASSGSNLAPTSKALAELFEQRAAELREQGMANPLPTDLVTASGSGLDPHVSPAAAFAQVARVARARALNPEFVRALVQARIEARTFGVFGDERVNVLLLNLDLDRAR